MSCIEYSSPPPVELVTARIQSSHINRDVINPLLKQGQYFDAIDKGTDAILHELVTGTPGGVSDDGKQPGASKTNANRGGRRDARPPPSAGMSIVSTKLRDSLYGLLRRKAAQVPAARVETPVRIPLPRPTVRR